MISAATGAMALLMAPLVREHGLDYLLAATILTGVIRVLFGIFKVARVMKFIPRAVMIGFVNALAILIFMAQVPHVIGISLMTYVFLVITLAVIYLIPRFIIIISVPLIVIIDLPTVAIYSYSELRTVGDVGIITKSLPEFFIPNVPLNIETLAIISPYSIALSIVSLLETLLTSSMVDDMTDTD